jgi:hypothetical protein
MQMRMVKQKAGKHGVILFIGNRFNKYSKGMEKWRRTFATKPRRVESEPYQCERTVLAADVICLF